MPLENLPPSTVDIAMDALLGHVDVEHASTWATDLVALGHLDEHTVALAGLSPTDWLGGETLLPEVAGRIGLDLKDRQTLLRWIERHFLENWMSGVLSEMDLIDCGHAIWARLVAVDDQPNPFRIYNDLGDLISMETGGRDLDSLNRPDRRAWVENHLLTDGAFDRTGLELP